MRVSARLSRHFLQARYQAHRTHTRTHMRHAHTQATTPPQSGLCPSVAASGKNEPSHSRGPAPPPKDIPIDPIHAFVTDASLGLHWIARLRATGFADAAALAAMSKFRKAHVDEFIAQTFSNATELEKFLLVRVFNPQE
ncbi:hypothetical protein C8R43DRAFT_955640 [Mycena crocata]|nr:hypothetical protein C8R43DRAFT_955640 [Mycena crocata]